MGGGWGGVGVGWGKLAAGPSPLQRAQKIVKNDVSYMGVKPLIVTLSTPVKICKLLQSCKSLKLPSAQLEERGRKKGGWLARAVPHSASYESSSIQMRP